MDYEKLKGLYGRLLGLKESMPDPRNSITAILGDDYNMIVYSMAEITGEDYNSYKIPDDQYYTFGGTSRHIHRDAFTRMRQFISYLSTKYNLNDKILEVGSLIGAIENQELRDRCLDLLSARGKFDRVINQATQVLEDTIRTKSGVTGKTGTDLINIVFKDDPADSVLIIDGEPEEHECFAHICRGIMLGFGNLTHHKLVDKFTREDALKFCGFIDVLLKFIESSKKNTK